jgi:hypothetical protein
MLRIYHYYYCDFIMPDHSHAQLKGRSHCYHQSSMLKDHRVCMLKSTSAKISSCCALAYSSRQALRIRSYGVDRDTLTPSLRTCLILAADLLYGVVGLRRFR